MNTLYAMQESANHQAQMGQYLFRMKMGDPMVAFKIKYFQKNVKDQVLGLVRTTMGEEMTRTRQEFAFVEISYDEDGTVKNVLFPGFT